MSVPNILTGIRLCLVPVFPFVYMSNIQNAHIYASVIFILAMMLDVLDGFIARKFNMITKFGKVFDPLADKFMVMSVTITLAFTGRIISWFLCFVLVKEVGMIIAGIFLYKKEDIVIPSNIFGKFATFAMFFFLLVAIYSDIDLTFYSFAMVVIMLCALITYMIELFKERNKSRSDS